MGLPWKELYFGRVSPEEVQEAVQDVAWQRLRKEMRGRALEEKYNMLEKYYMETLWYLSTNYRNGAYNKMPPGTYAHDVRMLQVRCTNYITALSRGGLIKPSDYR